MCRRERIRCVEGVRAFGAKDAHPKSNIFEIFNKLAYGRTIDCWRGMKL